MNDEYTMGSFETDTGQLWYAGVLLLPSMAARYSLMSATVQVSSDVDSDFSDGTGPSNRLPELYREWSQLRDTFQDILALMATNLSGTGNALRVLAENLASTDAAGATEIANASADLASN